VYSWAWESNDEAPTRVTIEFLDRENQTEVHITHEGFPTVQERDNHVLGWTDCLDRLDTLLRACRPV
jgi:glutathione S-transferase